MDSLPEFSKLLIQARSRLGLSQAQLANKLKVSVAAISKWETGKSHPDISRLSLISQVTHIPLLELSLSFAGSSAYTGKDHCIMISKNDYEKLPECTSREDLSRLENYSGSNLIKRNGSISAILLNDDEYALYLYICLWKPDYSPLKFFTELILPLYTEHKDIEA